MSPFPTPESLLPHRPPQLYVHRILSLELGSAGPDGSLEGQGPRMIAEGDLRPEDFPGHFPGRVIVPGVAYIEALAQTLACLAALSGEGGPHVLTGVERAKFKGICLPPATLRFEVQVTERRFRLTWAKGKVTRDGITLCLATLQAAPMPAELAREVLQGDPR